MKNLIIGPAFPLRGGIANFNEALCSAFVKDGIDSKIISFSLQYPGFLFPGNSQYATGDGPKGFLIETKINSLNPFNWFLVANYIRKQNPDYIVVRYWLPFMAPCLGTIARLVKRKKNIKVIAITDNVIPHEKRPGDFLFTKYFVNSCDSFVVMSKSVLTDLEKFTSNQNKVFIPHPVYDIFGEKIGKEEALKKLDLNTNDKHLLFFGFIRKYKGLDLLLQAMADDRVKQLGVKLIVAGEYYEDCSYYENIINQNNIKNVILKTNYIPSEEVKNYFCAADIVVQPYRTATQSGVTQIAYHFERPILVTNVGGLAEIVPDNKVGYVTEPSPKSIADAIIHFYEIKKEEEFARNVSLEKHRFTWTAMVQGIQDLFEKIK